MYEWIPVSIVAGTCLLGIAIDAWQAGWLQRLTAPWINLRPPA